MIEPQQSAKPVFDNGEIDLRELFDVLAAGKGLISAFVSTFFVAAFVLAAALPNIYTAHAVLAPAESSGRSGNGLMRQYAGLAGLAGLSLVNNDDGRRTQLGLQLMKSRSFIGEFVKRRSILPELIAAKDWDSLSGEVVFDSDLYDGASHQWLSSSDAKDSSIPSAQEAHRAFTAILNVAQDKQTGYISVSIEHYSPVIAAQWVNWLVEDVNSAVRAQDVAEAEKSIEYLRKQVSSTALTDLQAVFFDLIQSQTETVMLAEVRQEYVFKTIDPAVIPEESDKPNRFMICFFGSLFGLISGAIVVLFRRCVAPN